MTSRFAAHIRRCRSCDAPIIWARTLAGRVMPVDAEPGPSGNVLLELRQGHVRATVYSAETAEETYGQTASKVLRRSHFASCPDADRWRHRA